MSLHCFQLVRKILSVTITFPYLNYRSRFILIILSIRIIHSIPLHFLSKNLSYLWQKYWGASTVLIHIHLCLLFLHIIKWLQVRLEKMDRQHWVILGYMLIFTSLWNVKQMCVAEWKYITCVHESVFLGLLLLWSVYRYEHGHLLPEAISML